MQSLALTFTLAMSGTATAQTIRTGGTGGALAVMRVLNSVIPRVKTIADGAYPYFKSYYISTAATPSSVNNLFIDFVLSPRRRPVLESMGHGVAPAKTAH
jgi:hypothetical protein